jgi:hypothetical protein
LCSLCESVQQKRQTRQLLSEPIVQICPDARTLLLHRIGETISEVTLIGHLWMIFLMLVH